MLSTIGSACIRHFGGVIMVYTAIGRCVADSLFVQERNTVRPAPPFRY